ncbi:MAG: class I SAM-dependent methyltransferase [Sphingomicrobium sp.]
MNDIALEAFANEYARHRAREGRGYTDEQLLRLPYLKTGPHAAQWAVRARTFNAFMARVLRPTARRLERSLDVLDLGAGNGWLAYRIALEGHHAVAVDIRSDAVDGLGAATPFLTRAPLMERIVSSFDAVPLPTASVDIALFNASIHYATDLRGVLREAIRLTRPGGRVAILDSPFYSSEANGLAMVAEKRERFGAGADILLALPFIEFLTRERLREAAPELQWKRHRVRYPIGYELRPLVAALTGKRRPSRFDLWVADAR